MGRRRDVDWASALVGVFMMLVGGYAGRTAPGLWASAIRYANAPGCATPNQIDCVRHLNVRVWSVSDDDTLRGPVHRVEFMGARSITLNPPLRSVELVPARPSVDRLALGAAAPVTVRVWDGR